MRFVSKSLVISRMTLSTHDSWPFLHSVLVDSWWSPTGDDGRNVGQLRKKGSS